MSRLTELFPRWPDVLGALDLWTERAFPSPPSAAVEAGYPALNVFEKQDRIFIEAELPGVGPEELNVSVTGREALLAGIRKAPTQPEVTWTRQERPYGPFSRTITLPWEIDPESVAATLRDGVLSISLAKSERCRTKKVAVRTT